MRSGETRSAFKCVRYVHSTDESKDLNDSEEPMVILSASGMCEGGRILHHLRNNIDKGTTTVLIVGYQAEGTLGRRLQDGAKKVRSSACQQNVRARVETLAHVLRPRRPRGPALVRQIDRAGPRAGSSSSTASSKSARRSPRGLARRESCASPSPATATSSSSSSALVQDDDPGDGAHPAGQRLHLLGPEAVREEADRVAVESHDADVLALAAAADEGDDRPAAGVGLDLALVESLADHARRARGRDGFVAAAAQKVEARTREVALALQQRAHGDKALARDERHAAALPPRNTSRRNARNNG